MNGFALVVIPLKRKKKAYLPGGAICHGCFGITLILKEGLCKHCFRHKKFEKEDKKVWKW